MDAFFLQLNEPVPLNQCDDFYTHQTRSNKEIFCTSWKSFIQLRKTFHATHPTQHYAHQHRAESFFITPENTSLHLTYVGNNVSADAILASFPLDVLQCLVSSTGETITSRAFRDTNSGTTIHMCSKDPWPPKSAWQQAAQLGFLPSSLCVHVDDGDLVTVQDLLSSTTSLSSSSPPPPDMIHVTSLTIPPYVPVPLPCYRLVPVPRITTMEDTTCLHLLRQVMHPPGSDSHPTFYHQEIKKSKEKI
jgi:hypothetical protein